MLPCVFFAAHLCCLQRLGSRICTKMISLYVCCTVLTMRLAIYLLKWWVAAVKTWPWTPNWHTCLNKTFLMSCQCPQASGAGVWNIFKTNLCCWHAMFFLPWHVFNITVVCSDSSTVASHLTRTRRCEGLAWQKAKQSSSHVMLSNFSVLNIVNMCKIM